MHAEPPAPDPRPVVLDNGSAGPAARPGPRPRTVLVVAVFAVLAVGDLVAAGWSLWSAVGHATPADPPAPLWFSPPAPVLVSPPVTMDPTPTLTGTG